MKIRLLLSYKGTHFFGWQRQKQKRTVQEELEKSLFQIFQKEIRLTGSGRTDAGVHALGQTAHFELEKELFSQKGFFEEKKFKKAFNAVCPPDISVLECQLAPSHFHALSSAVKKTYLYFVWTGDSPPVLFSDLLYWRKESLDLEKLNALAHVFKGKHDFKSFQNSGTELKTTTREVFTSRWSQLSSSLYCYKITGSGFLKQMVRNIVGTSLELLHFEKTSVKSSPSSSQKTPLKATQKLEQILLAKDRKQALKTAPGRGLYLKKVFYPSSLDKACRLL